jgi:hypothetical protein
MITALKFWLLFGFVPVGDVPKPPYRMPITRVVCYGLACKQGFRCP